MEIVLIDGRAEPVVDEAGQVCGVVALDDDAPPGRASIEPGVYAAGALPVTVSLPPWATHAEIRPLGSNIRLRLEPGARELRPEDLGAPGVSVVACMVAPVSGSLDGLWSRQHFVFATVAAPVDPPGIRVEGSLIFESTWIEDDPLTIASRPVVRWPANATSALVIEVYDAGGALLRTDTEEAWETVSGVDGECPEGVFTASHPDHPDVVIRTPRYRVNGVTIESIFTPTAGELEVALNAGLTRCVVKTPNPGAQGGVTTNNAFAHCVTPVLACGVLSGSAAAKSRLDAQITHWLSGNRAPAGYGGYAAQYDARVVSAIGILSTSAAWDTLSFANQRRLELIMLGCAVGAAWPASAENPYRNGALPGELRSVRGFMTVAGQINFATPGYLTLPVVDAFLRRRGSSLQAFFSSFDRDAFASEILAAGELGHLYTTYSRDWTNAQIAAYYGAAGVFPDYAPGPSKAMLHAALRDAHAGGIYRMTIPGVGTFTLDQGHAVICGELSRMCNRVVSPGGSTYGPGTPLPGRMTTGMPELEVYSLPENGSLLRTVSTWAEVNGGPNEWVGSKVEANPGGIVHRSFRLPATSPEAAALFGVTPTAWPAGYGLVINNSPLLTNDNSGRFAANYPINGELRGCAGYPNQDLSTNISLWPFLPNAGQVGRFNELLATDGGNLGNPAIRLSPGYAWHGTATGLSLTTAGCVLGVVNPEASDFQEAAARLHVGATDFIWLTRYGWREYSKGGGVHPNHDFGLNFLNFAGGDPAGNPARNGAFETFVSEARMVLKFSGRDLIVIE